MSSSANLQRCDEQIEIFSRQGKWCDVVSKAEEKIKIVKEVFGAESEKIIECFLLRGAALHRIRSFVESKDTLNKARPLVMLHHGKNSLMYASWLRLQSNNEVKLGHAPLAVDLAKNSLKILKRLSKKRPDEDDIAHESSQTLDTLSLSLLKVGLPSTFEDALKYSRDSYSIKSKFFGPHDIRSAGSLNTMSLILISLGRMNESFDLLELCLSIFIENLGENHPEVEVLLRNQSKLLQDMGFLEDAINRLQRLSKIQNSNGAVGEREITEKLITSLVDKVKDGKRVEDSLPRMPTSAELQRLQISSKHQIREPLRRDLWEEPWSELELKQIEKKGDDGVLR